MWNAIIIIFYIIGIIHFPTILLINQKIGKMEQNCQITENLFKIIYQDNFFNKSIVWSVIYSLCSITALFIPLLFFEDFSKIRKALALAMSVIFINMLVFIDFGLHATIYVSSTLSENYICDYYKNSALKFITVERYYSLFGLFISSSTCIYFSGLYFCKLLKKIFSF